MANEVRLIFGAATDVGRVREVNEDSHGLVRCRWGDLFVVCDGMGGHAAGDVASQTARDAILAHALASQATDAKAMLHDALVHGHEAIHDVVRATSGREGMGTTAVLALVREGWVYFANVGDSRGYLVRGGTAQQVSKDHTRAQKLLDQGLISAAQFAEHPERGVLSQALGQRATPEPHVAEPIPLQADDVIVLCTDGAYDSMHSDLGGLVAAAKNPNYAAHDLVAQAVERDGKDNATTIIVRWDALATSAASVAPVAAVPPQPDLAKRAAASAAPSWLRPRNVAVGAVTLAVAAGGIGYGVADNKCPPSVSAQKVEEKPRTSPSSVPSRSAQPAVQPGPAAEEKGPRDDRGGDTQPSFQLELEHNRRPAAGPPGSTGPGNRPAGTKQGRREQVVPAGQTGPAKEPSAQAAAANPPAPSTQPASKGAAPDANSLDTRAAPVRKETTAAAPAPTSGPPPAPPSAAGRPIHQPQARGKPAATRPTKK
jgi:serine/threonine protein phosphatase PrpC